MFSRRTLRLLGLACLLLSLAPEAAAQIGGVTGAVSDANGTPVAGAIVMAKGDYIKSVRANEKGEFRLTLRPGRWVLTVRKSGYRDQKVEVFVADYKNTVSLPNKIVLPALR